MLVTAKRHFAALGWAILVPSILGADFDVSKGDVYFAIKCIDRNTLHFKSETQIVEELEATSRHFRAKRKTLVQVMDFDLSNATLPKLRSMGVAAVTSTSSEMSLKLNNCLLAPLVEESLLDWSSPAGNQSHASSPPIGLQS